jgi:hypothetical protein
MVGVDMRSNAWDLLFDDSRADHVTLPILSLTRTITGDTHSQVTPERRDEVVEHLPATLQSIAAYWRGPDRRLVWRNPIRSIMVGRQRTLPMRVGEEVQEVLRLVDTAVYALTEISFRHRLYRRADLVNDTTGYAFSDRAPRTKDSRGTTRFEDKTAARKFGAAGRQIRGASAARVTVARVTGREDM